MNIIFPEDTKETIDEIRDTIGRQITIHTLVTGIACPRCSLDPVTGLSASGLCPVCDGYYWMQTTSGVDIQAHVVWSKTEEKNWQSGGIIDDGDCYVTITYSGIYLDYVRNSEYFIVDSRDLYMQSWHLKGVPEPNRIKVILKEDTEEL
jgi:hypothetical protein